MTDLSSNTVIELHRAENHLVKRYMCREDFCPCAITIDPLIYGERSNEFEFLDRTGTVTQFYEGCYLNLVENGLEEEFSEEILTNIEMMEVELKCSGICETPLFWFFQSAKMGPPERSCKSEIVKNFRANAGALGLYAYSHGSINCAYFLMSLTFWKKYGEDE